MTNREFDEQFRRRGAVLLGGIDEAGRGHWRDRFSRRR